MRRRYKVWSLTGGGAIITAASWSFAQPPTLSAQERCPSEGTSDHVVYEEHDTLGDRKKKEAKFAEHANNHWRYVHEAEQKGKTPSDKEWLYQKADNEWRCVPKTVRDLARAQRDQTPPKYFEALATFRRIIGTKQPANREWAAAVEDAEREARALEDRIPKISLDHAPLHAVLEIDGRAASLDEANLVTPGKHKIALRANGYKDLLREPDLKEYERYALPAPEESALPSWPWPEDVEQMRVWERVTREGRCDSLLYFLLSVEQNKHDPRLMFDRALCHLQLQQYVDAYRQFDRFLRTPSDPTLDVWRARAKTRYIPQVKAEVAHLTLTIGGPDTLFEVDGRRVDDRSEDVPFMVEPVWNHDATHHEWRMILNPGIHTVFMRRSGYVSIYRVLDLRSRASQSVQMNVIPLGPWIVGGIGVGAIIIGAFTGIAVLQQKSLVNANGCISGPPPTCLNQAGVDAANTGRVLGPVSTVALTVGAAGIVAGGIWLGVSRPGKLSARIGATPTAWRLEGSW